MAKTYEIKRRYENAVHEYAAAFCRRHGWVYSPDDWVGGRIGEVLEVCDMFVDFRDIRTDVDREAPENAFDEWYWYELELHELGCTKHVNYEHFLMGCPLPYSEEDLEKIHEAHRRVEEAKAMLEDLINS